MGAKNKEESYYNSFTSRHKGILTPTEQNIISQCTICGAGAGGTGGWTYLALARMGFCNFKIADPENFDHSNINRQAGSNSETIGENKAEIISTEIKKINPYASVIVFSEGLHMNNIQSFIDNGDIIIDAIDLYEMKIKKLLFDEARIKELPVISSPVLAFGTAIGIFHPTKSPEFDKYFGPIPDRDNSTEFNLYIKNFGLKFFSFKPRLNWPLFKTQIKNGEVPSIGTSCMMAGSLSSDAVIDLILERNNFPIVPDTIHIDLMQLKIKRNNLLNRFLLQQHIRFKGL